MRIVIILVWTGWLLTLAWAITLLTVHGPRKLVPPIPTRFESELEVLYRAPAAKGRYR